MTFRITIRVYTNTENTNVLFGGEDDEILDFGDGSDPDGDGKVGFLVPAQLNQETVELEIGMAFATFAIDHTYSPIGFYVVSYSEPNRTQGILNMDESVSTRFYIESAFTADPTLVNAYQSPESLMTAPFRVRAGTPLSATLACKDTADYKLSYVAVVPKRSRSLPVANYRYPENFFVNRYTGVMEWDGNFMSTKTIGEFSFAIKVFQTDAKGNIIGYKIRDFQVIAEESDISIGLTDDVELSVNNEIFVGENMDSTITVYAEANGVDKLTLTASSELFSETNFHFQTEDILTGDGTKAKVGRLSLHTAQEIVRTNPYNIAVRLSATKGYSEFFIKDISYLFYTTPLSDVITRNEAVVTMVPEIYPNPANTFVKILLPGYDKKIRVSITDLSGRCIDQLWMTESGIYDVRGFVPGLYIITFSDKILYKPIRLCIK
jgi:hypothetical protein